MSDPRGMIEHQTITPGGRTMTVKGIDVASYQPTTYPTTGVQFVVIKATEGTTYVNPHMAGQLATARKIGAVVGFYHFLRPGNIDKQARFFLDTAPEGAADFLAIDWETESGTAPSCAEKDSAIKAVKKLVPHHRVLLYCNRDFWLNRDTTSYCGDGLWIADPGAPAGKPRVQHAWTIHQHATAGGIDQNVGAFADRDAMLRWAKGLAAAPTTPVLTTEQRLSKLEKRVTALEKKEGV